MEVSQALTARTVFTLCDMNAQPLLMSCAHTHAVPKSAGKMDNESQVYIHDAVLHEVH